METLGVWLHQAREAKGATLKEAEAATRIRARFLELLEAGDFDAFPGGEVQIRGFLRIYARYLGLSPEEAVARYEAETRPTEVRSGASPQAAPSAGLLRSDVVPVAREPRVSPGPTATSAPRLSVETVMIAVIVLIVLLVLIAAVTYFVGQKAGGGAVATETVSAQAAQPTTTVPATLAVVTPTFPANPEGGVNLALEANEHVWVRVSVDGVVAFEGMLAPGEMTWSGREAIVVDTGNGDALLVTVNGQAQGKMCGRGRVCTRAWGPAGELAAPPPSPTMSP